MKKLFMTLIVQMLCLITTTNAQVANTVLNGLVYNSNGTGTVEITNYAQGFPHALYIPASVSIGGTEYAVTTIADEAFAYCNDITSVHIPTSVSHIGHRAFYSCNKLKTVTFYPTFTGEVANVTTNTKDYAHGDVFGNTWDSNDFAIHLPVGSTIPNWLGKIVYDCYGNVSINLSSADATMGSVFGDGNNFCNNSTYNIVAEANIGYEFSAWNDGNTDNPRSIYLTGDTAFVATFTVLTKFFIPNIPLAPRWFYDTDGDGKMEFFVPESKYVNNQYEHKLVNYTKEGVLSKSFTFSLTNWIDEFSECFLDFGNFDGSDYPDFFLKGKFVSNNNRFHTYLYTGNADGSFTEKTIKKPAYDTGDYDGVENEIPVVTIDANGDGRIDLYGYNAKTLEHYFLLQQADGTFMRKTIRVLTDEEEIDNAMIAKEDAPIVAPTAIRFSGVSLAKVIRQDLMKEDKKQTLLKSSTIAWSDNVTSIDLNMDGYPDIIDKTNGGALISIDEGVYYFGTFKGIPTARDLNGDGVLDYILYDTKTKTVTLQIYTGEGGFRSQTLMQNMNISNVYCYDFDGDGDVDILLPFDYTESSQYAFLVFFQNNGDNTFTKKERSFSEKLFFKDCKDFDNDGLYEVIVVQKDSENNGYGYNHKLYKIKCRANDGWKVEKDAEPFCDYVKTNFGWNNDISEMTWIAGDFDNNGHTSYYTIQHKMIPLDGMGSYEDQGQFNLLGTFSALTDNASPAKMSAPTYVYDAASQIIRIEWQAGSDDLTASADLTYALRIGSASGQGDVLYAYANADGSRRRLGEGNNGSALFRLMHTDGWATGNYYFAVQAVDAHGRGGAWSDETVFNLTQISSEFNLPYTQTTTVDTLSLVLKAPIHNDYTYNWSFGDDAELISEENGTWKILYNSAGLKTISLQVVDKQGKKSIVTEKQIDVFAVKFEYANIKIGEKKISSGSYFDADMNGKLDILSGTIYSSEPESYIYGLLEGDGTGGFTKVGRTYNSDLIPTYVHFIDFNMDGTPDFIGSTNKGNVFINGDDFDFEFSTENIVAPKLTNGEYIFDNSYNWGNVYLIDLNNDGFLDIISNVSKAGVIYFNNGDNKNFTRFDMSEWKNQDYIHINSVADFNNDGYLDFIMYHSSNSKVYMRLNNGNNQFSTKEIPFLFSQSFCADLNGDGYPDMINWNTNDQVLYVYLGNAEADYSGNPVSFLMPDIEEYFRLAVQVADVDNNGYPDLIVGGGILYFYPDMETRWQSIASTHKGDKGIQIDTNNNMYPFSDVKGVGVDVNGDGVPDTKLYNMLSRISNTSPQTPQNVRASQTDEGIVLAWDAAVDAETPVTQMRYNVSVKEKGKSGNNSFIISPMNGLKDKALVIPDYKGYRKGTQMIVPASRFQAGKTYELRVQSIDLWNEHSPMSAVYEFKVESQANINMPQSACIDNPVTISYTGTETGTPVWDWDGGTVISSGNNTWQVQWSSGGVKNVKVTVGSKSATRPIKVRDDVDISFSLPTTVLAKCNIPFTLPAIFNDPSKLVQIRTSDNNKNAVEVGGTQGLSITTPIGSNTITVKRRSGSLEAMAYFPENGTHWIELVYNDDSCGEITYRQYVQVLGENLTPQITLVTVDFATGKNKIIWKEPTDVDTQIFNKIEIYKEMGSTNNFIKIDEVPINAEMYIDQDSDPLVRKSRYRIALGTTFGGTSNMSEVHSSVHVMINKGLGNSINLIWSKYEGAIIDSYTIMRGTSPENMQVIATASGYENSYTDLNAPENVYYSLSYNNIYSDKWITLSQVNKVMRAGVLKSNLASGSSNIVSSNESNVVTFAQSIYAMALEKELKITSEQLTLHLYAEVLPAMATYKMVNWSIVYGEELVEISEKGVVSYIGEGINGEVCVQAKTVDGTNLDAKIYIDVQGFKSVKDVEIFNEINNENDNIIIHPNPVKEKLNIINITEKTHITVCDITGYIIYNDICSSNVEISFANYPSGVYIVNCISEHQKVSYKVIKE